ncbi:MAG TPA: 50S ribosomal protein L23, partial [Dehalococcoidia bacterium]
MPKQLHAYGIILRPLITEKAQNMTHLGKYAFEVDRRANK